MCAQFALRCNELRNIMRQYYDRKQVYRREETQSIFYMPIISVAYWIVRCQRQRKTTRMICFKILEHISKIFYIIDCNNYDDTFDILCIILTHICDYINHHYEMIEEYYNKDKGIPMNGISHIGQKEQEEILNNSKIRKDEMEIICNKCKKSVSDVITYNENDTIDIKYIIDIFIQMH